jgi:hypothetical protein
LIITKNITNYKHDITYIYKLLSFCENVFKNSSNAQIFTYLCLHGAATTWVLQNDLDIPDATVYRVLKMLRLKKVVVPAIRVSRIKKSRGGPRPTVWALEGASKEEIAKAVSLHYRMLSPKYRVAEEVAQTILDEYIAPRQVFEISYREIVIKVKELKIPFRAPDIADLAAQYLTEQGVKVWR